MSDDKPLPPPPKMVIPKFVEQWSGITPVDFGLQAGFYPEEKGGSVTFRPVLGWVTATSQNRETGETNNQFHAVVLGIASAPIPAALLPGYLGVFPKTMAPHEAWAYSRRWRKKTDDESDGPPVPAEEGAKPEDPQNLNNVIPFRPK